MIAGTRRRCGARRANCTGPNPINGKIKIRPSGSVSVDLSKGGHNGFGQTMAINDGLRCSKGPSPACRRLIILVPAIWPGAGP